MNNTERDLIERLFQKINQVAAQSAPRDPQAEDLINRNVQQIPGAAYYMAQTMIVQRQALKQAEARIAQLEQHLGMQPGGQGSFLAPQQGGYGQPGYDPRYGQQQPYYNDDRRGGFFGGGGGGFGGGGFLAGAAQTALGVAGGVLLGNAAMSLFDGVGSAAGDLFSDNPVESVASNFSDAPQAETMGFDQGAGGAVDTGESGGFLDGGDFGGGEGGDW